MKDGYYWAKSASVGEAGWHPVKVETVYGQQRVYVIGRDDDRPLGWFEFGPQIIPPTASALIDPQVFTGAHVIYVQPNGAVTEKTIQFPPPESAE